MNVRSIKFKTSLPAGIAIAASLAAPGVLNNLLLRNAVIEFEKRKLQSDTIVSSRIISPVIELINKSGLVSRGNCSERADTARKDEIGILFLLLMK